MGVSFDKQTFQKVAHNQLRVWGTITFDASYPTGGEDVAALGAILEMDVKPVAGYVFAFDKPNKKVLAYWAGDLAITDIALSTSGGNTYTDAAVNSAVNAIKTGPTEKLKEVADTTNLSTVTARFEALLEVKSGVP